MTASDLPKLALSVRQPWAWAIIYAGKDIENRSWQAVNHGLRVRGRIAVHAAKGMTRDEYDTTQDFLARLRIACPAAKDLARGGIIGSVEVVDVVSKSESPWFFGPRGLVLRDPRPSEFIPAVGALGYFHWTPGDALIAPAPATWMLRTDQPDDGTRTPERFVDAIRSALRARGISGPGTASITVRNNKAVLNVLAGGIVHAVSLDALYDRFRVGLSFEAKLSETLDQHFTQARKEPHQ